MQEAGVREKVRQLKKAREREGGQVKRKEINRERKRSKERERKRR